MYGEIFEIPEALLPNVDRLEICPQWYDRVLVKVEMVPELESTQGQKDNQSPQKTPCELCDPADGSSRQGKPGDIVDCYLYLGNPAHYKPEFLATEAHEKYPEGLVCASQLDDAAVKGVYEKYFVVPMR